MEDSMNDKLLPCGHPPQCRYFHPALRGGMRYRCIACDYPKGNSVHMQRLIKDGVVKARVV